MPKVKSESKPATGATGDATKPKSAIAKPTQGWSPQQLSDTAAREIVRMCIAQGHADAVIEELNDNEAARETLLEATPAPKAPRVVTVLLVGDDGPLNGTYAHIPLKSRRGAEHCVPVWLAMLLKQHESEVDKELQRLDRPGAKEQEAFNGHFETNFSSLGGPLHEWEDAESTTEWAHERLAQMPEEDLLLALDSLGLVKADVFKDKGRSAEKYYNNNTEDVTEALREGLTELAEAKKLGARALSAREVDEYRTKSIGLRCVATIVINEQLLNDL